MLRVNTVQLRLNACAPYQGDTERQSDGDSGGHAPAFWLTLVFLEVMKAIICGLAEAKMVGVLPHTALILSCLYPIIYPCPVASR